MIKIILRKLGLVFGGTYDSDTQTNLRLIVYLLLVIAIILLIK